MGLRDILKDAMDFAGVPIPDRQFITEYNRVLHDLAMTYDTAKTRQAQTIICDNQEAEYSLPSGCLKIERVLTSHGNYFSMYQVRGNSKIKFAVRDTYSLDLLFEQPDVSSMTDDVTIDGTYLKAVAEYIASKAVKKNDQDKSKQLMQDSATDAAAANKNIRRASNPNRRTFAPRFR